MWWPVVQWLIIFGMMATGYLAITGRTGETVWTGILTFLIIVWTVVGWEIAAGLHS